MHPPGKQLTYNKEKLACFLFISVNYAFQTAPEFLGYDYLGLDYLELERLGFVCLLAKGYHEGF